MQRFDLEERTLEFAKRIVHLAKSLKRDPVNDMLSGQVARSGTSPGANYREANETETKKDFNHKIMICRKEAKETEYWLILIIEANPELKARIDPLLQEARELVKIFASIGRS